MPRESFLPAMVLVVVLASSRSAMSQRSICDSGMDVVFQDEPVSTPGHQTSEVFAHAIDSLIVEVPRGETARTKMYCAIVSRIPGNEGVQSWSLSALSTGDVLVADSSGRRSPPAPTRPTRTTRAAST